ncbi:cysteine--tRNA ligase [Candidatus Woesebacteria bacterium]|nr:cysteine--tRNA ligase [Candidatus Woesebacteria bacterium]|tara:strand:- start:225 stop:1670 length:1446 start_codon:yes stop_codon:yes gene_type:complete
MRIFNSLTRKKEEFKPIHAQNVGMYTCGPTVYDFSSIGNFRTYVTSDVLRRTLTLNGYKVKSVMNITDVGHLTGDGDLGEDKLAKAAKREHKTAWDIAKFYGEAFEKDSKKLNILPHDVVARATDHIKEQIQLIRRLEGKGFTYKTSDGIYFDTVKYEKDTGAKYGELSTLDEIKEGSRVEKNPEKKNPRDFALWKFSYKGGRSFDSAQDDAASCRHMEWESPWGFGFPGWHIECSAMSMKYLGETFDVHTGGEDLRQTHHPNEVAQSEGATGKKFVNYWMHVTFLLVDGKRMGKSVGNAYTVSDVEKKGIEPLALRYLYLTAHYRDPLNFTWEALEGAQSALERLRSQVSNFSSQESGGGKGKVKEYRDKFTDALDNDLGTPQALAVVWDVVKSDISSVDKRKLILSFDEVLGLEVSKVPQVSKVPKEVRERVRQREELRKQEKWDEADKVRKEMLEMGYTIKDTDSGPQVKKLRVTSNK